MSINLYPTDWREAWQVQLADLRRQFPHAHIYALVEGVLNETCYPLLKRAGNLPFFALYANTPSADEETLCVSPILVEYVESAQQTWHSLIKKTDGRSALSLIVSPESLQQIAARLTPWCIVDAAGYTLALSFADTRILPELFKVLRSEQLTQLCGPALHWQYLTRKAEWCALPVPKSDALPADAVVLDDKQCAHLMTASEADNVLFQLRRNAANLVDCHTPARAHEMVRHWLDCANHAQIGAAPERASLCELGLTYPALETDKRVVAWRAGQSQPQSVEALQAQWE